MNKKIGICASIVDACAVIAFTFRVLTRNNLGSCLVCILVAFGFVPIIRTFTFYSSFEKKIAGDTVIISAGMHAVFILLVYSAQVTAMRLDDLNEQAIQTLFYPKFGLFFSYDLLGYRLMATSTFFTGLVVEVKTKLDKWLKWLLLIHGVFAVAYFVLPIIGLFRTGMEGTEWIRTAILTFRCVYLAPVSILSFLHLKNQ